MPTLKLTLTTVGQRLVPAGPIIRATLIPDALGIAYLKTNHLPAAAPITLDMLVDTGSDATVIDLGKILPWNLPRTNFGTVNGLPAEAYRMDLSFQGATKAQPQWHLLGRQVLAAARPLNHNCFDGLVGRDLLNGVVLEYDGPHNTFSIHFK